MELEILGGTKRKMDWVTIVLNKQEIEKYIKMITGLELASDVKLVVDINDKESYIDIDYYNNNDDILFQFESNGFHDGGLKDFEITVRKTFGIDEFTYFIVGQLVYLCLAPETYQKKKKEGKLS